tara:strand:- start:251 stop:811 length:561 start_codon:yes stop_codon:yes gene_type:complete
MQERSLNDNFLSNIVALNNGKNKERIEFLLYNVLKLDTQSFKQENDSSIIESLFEIQQENEEYDPVTGYSYANINEDDNQLNSLKRNPPVEHKPSFIYKFKNKDYNQQNPFGYTIRNTPQKLYPDYHDELIQLFSQETNQENDYESDMDDDESIPLLFMLFHTTRSQPKMSTHKTRKRCRNKLKIV